MQPHTKQEKGDPPAECLDSPLRPFHEEPRKAPGKLGDFHTGWASVCVGELLGSVSPGGALGPARTLQGSSRTSRKLVSHRLAGEIERPKAQPHNPPASQGFSARFFLPQKRKGSSFLLGPLRNRKGERNSGVLRSKTKNYLGTGLIALWWKETAQQKAKGEPTQSRAREAPKTAAWGGASSLRAMGLPL